jgi:hypothetical protein
MLKLKRKEVYSERTQVADAGLNRNVIDEFIGAVTTRLGNQRLPIAEVTVEEVQVGGSWLGEKRTLRAVVAKTLQPPVQRAIFLCIQAGTYASFGVYLTTEVGFVALKSADEIMAQIKDSISDFDKIAFFNLFQGTMELVLDQVVSDDLRLAGKTHSVGGVGKAAGLAGKLLGSVDMGGAASLLGDG